jgi:hypothetical protein
MAHDFNRGDINMNRANYVKHLAHDFSRGNVDM